MKEERDLYFTKHPTDLTHLETNESWDLNTLNQKLKRNLYYSTSYSTGYRTIKTT